MTSDYKEYLAANVLGDGRVITYRLLSRALKVHVNAAKQMLFEFHRQQNAKKPGSIYATYLLCGTRRKDEKSATTAEARDGDDVHMQSSPFMSSSMPHEGEEQEVTSMQTIILVKEKDLDQIVSSFERLSSIHVYSLEPAALYDLQILSDATREVISTYGQEGPMKYDPVYGTIHNKDVRRRAGRRPPPQAISAPPTQKQQIVKEKPKQISHISTNAKSSQSFTKDFFNKPNNDKKATPPTSQKPADSVPTLKRDSSSIFKSFAKAKPKPKPEATDSLAAPSTRTSVTEDSPMKDVSDDDEENYIPPPQVLKEDVKRDRQAREENRALLSKMMEVDDEPATEPVSNEDPVEVDESEVTSENSADPEPEPVAEIKNGRRRGKRRVMKKKTMKDDEGYLVTKEEAVWESFSEDEPVVPKPKTQSTMASTTGKKKPAVNTGQGSIMSFFGKK